MNNDLSPKDMLNSSLARGLRVLESFSPNKDHYTLAELSKLLGIPKSSLHRVMKTLFYMNYVRYDEHSKRYYLGTGVLSLGFSVLQSMELREIARPYLEKISRQVNITANLAVLDKLDMVYVERVRVPGHRMFNRSIGSRMAVWNTAVGRSVLAFLDPDKLREIIGKLKEIPEFIMDGGEATLIKHLEMVRKDGYAINDQDSRKWVRAVAAPIFSAEGVVAAMNLTGEAEEVTVDDLRKKLAPPLLAVAKEFSEALGHRA